MFAKLNNCTLLDDVEAPSRMWENTICDDAAPQTSPIKLIGLLRPSTIIEEALEEVYNSDVSSQLSFKTTTKTVQSDISSSTYNTADDYSVASSQTDRSIPKGKQEVEIINVDHIVFPTIEKNHKQKKEEDLIIPNIEKIDSTIIETSSLSNQDSNDSDSSNKIENQTANKDIVKPIHDLLDTTIVELASLSVDNNKEPTNNTSNDSVSMINIEQLFDPMYNLSRSSLGEIGSDNTKAVIQNSYDLDRSEDTEDDLLNDSIIEILSDDDDEKERDMNVNTSRRKEACCIEIKSKLNLKDSNFLNQDTYSFNGSLDNKENIARAEESSHNSMQFNDTMEEVEYILKKGMEFMAAEAVSKEDYKTTEEHGHLPKVHVIKTQSNSSTTHKKQHKNEPSSVPKGKYSNKDNSKFESITIYSFF